MQNIAALVVPQDKANENLNFCFNFTLAGRHLWIAIRQKEIATFREDLQFVLRIGSAHNKGVLPKTNTVQMSYSSNIFQNETLVYIYVRA